MKQWPHAPLHRLELNGTYIVTAGTYQKQHFFQAPESLTFLHDTLLLLAKEFGWLMQAWSVFSNHYHFLAISPSNPGNLKIFIKQLHTITARYINSRDDTPRRKVWFQYWDTRITHDGSYLARLHYVKQNPVKHNLVANACNYEWCSASWFEQNSDKAFRLAVDALNVDAVNVFDEF